MIKKNSILFGAIGALVLVVIAAVVVMRPGRDALSAEEVREIAKIKGEAERLAIDGRLAEAHAKYQLIEERVGGRRIKDTAVWDLVERAKGDQDRVYSLLLSEMEANLVARTAAATRPATRYIVVGNEPPKEKYPTELVATTQPVAVVTTQPVNPFAMFRPLLERAAEPSPRLSPGVPGEGGRGVPGEGGMRPATTQQAKGLPIAPMPAPKQPVSDEQIGQAIQKGVNFLLEQFKGDQVAVEKQLDKTHLEGLNALVIYSLLQSGQAVSDARLSIQSPQMSGMVDRMKDHLMLVEAASPHAPVTYARSLRASALAVYNRPQDREVLKADVEYLIKSHADGAYTYNDKIGRFDKVRTNDVPGGDNGLRKWIGELAPRGSFYIDDQKPARIFLHNGEKGVPNLPAPPYPAPGLPGFKNMTGRERYEEPPGLPWDNSNSQYGLMGVWAGAEAGIEVPGQYWAIVDQHWKRWQLPTGEWEYDGTGKQGYYAMTVAGIASLFITYDFVEAPALGASVGREPFSANLAAGLKWLELGDNAVNVEQGKVYYRGYNLFGLQRVGRASGFKYFGGHDWYRELAAAVIARQFPNGAWGRADKGDDAIADTAYTLLFLARGRHPVMMNKLRFDGFWNNRSRDLSHLTWIASKELERVVNWQIVSTERDWSDWLDSPVLFISSHAAAKFKPDDLAKLRAFADGGGMIFTHADGGSPNFNAFAGELAKKLFPEYAYANLPQDHEIYSVQYPMKTKPQLKYVSNGSRILMVHSPTDLTTAWQVRDLSKRPSFELGMNLFVYASGKAELRNRLNSPYIADAPGKPAHEVKLARVKYGGNWNPEPYAWERFSRYLKQQVGWSVQTSVVEPGQLTSGIAHLTGTGELALSDAQVAALKNYVEGGGTLLIDACGGSGLFAQSVSALLAKAIPQAKSVVIAPTDPILHASFPGMEEIGTPVLRPYAEQKLGKGAGRLEMINFGKGRVIVSGIDLSSGMVGSNAWGIVGYEPGYAMKLVKNIVIWAENK